MRCIAGSIVVCAGAFLWGAGTMSETYGYAHGGSRGPGEFAYFAGAVTMICGFVGGDLVPEAIGNWLTNLFRPPSKIAGPVSPAEESRR
jgi:hypothetical protein